jgi:hypothetical protein
MFQKLVLHLYLWLSFWSSTHYLNSEPLILSVWTCVTSDPMELLGGKSNLVILRLDTPEVWVSSTSLFVSPVTPFSVSYLIIWKIWFTTQNICLVVLVFPAMMLLKIWLLPTRCSHNAQSYGVDPSPTPSLAAGPLDSVSSQVALLTSNIMDL